MAEDLDPDHEIQDGFGNPGKSLNYITLGSETVEELGSATVRVIPVGDSPYQDFDSITVCEIAGVASVIGKEAIQAGGEALFIPTRIIPYTEVESILIPVEDGRLEAADAELIGVGADQ